MINNLKKKINFSAEEFLNKVGKNGKTYREQTSNQYEQTKDALEEYVRNYTIISEQEFYQQINDITAALDAISQEGKTYSVVTSTPGKSNFWVAEKVLANVRTKPKSIYMMQVKEKGAHQKYTVSAENQRSMAGDDRHILVFLDDASYSGSQFSKILEQFYCVDREKIKIGQIARSGDAKNLIAKQGIDDTQYLNTPVEINKASHDDIQLLGKLAKIICPESNAPSESLNNGFYQTALFYKMPDFASTMDYIDFYEGYEQNNEPYKKQEYLKNFYNNATDLLNAKLGIGTTSKDITIVGITTDTVKQEYSMGSPTKTSPRSSFTFSPPLSPSRTSPHKRTNSDSSVRSTSSLEDISPRNTSFAGAIQEEDEEIDPNDKSLC